MTEPPATHTAQGRVLAGRYRLLGELGRGGMGVVWRAEDTVIGRQVAIKELRLPGGPHGGESAEVFAERVLREVRTSGRLNEPAVVTVYDVVKDGAEGSAGATYIVMELVDAPTLSDLVRQRGPLSADAVGAIGEQVLAALTAAHRAGIVHRDVKPGNIMVGANGRVKLTDFGIAQPVDDPRLTTSGFLVGSPAFMAPERIAGKDAVPASDLWSLGVTLYFAAEGTVAFERESTAATLHAIMNEVPYLSRTQGPLASAIMGMLITTPEARISAVQAAGLLRMAKSGAGVATPPGGQTAMYPGGRMPTVYADSQAVPGRAPKARPGKGWLIGAALFGVLLLAGGIVLGHWLGTPSTGQRDETWTVGQGGDVKAFMIGAGECSASTLDKGRDLSTADDCEQPHDIQVFDVNEPFNDYSLADYGYPGEALVTWAEARCAMTFESAIMDATKRENLRYRVLVPSQAQWDYQDAESSAYGRMIFCVAYDATGAQLSGSVLASTE